MMNKKRVDLKLLKEKFSEVKNKLRPVNKVIGKNDILSLLSKIKTEHKVRRENLKQEFHKQLYMPSLRSLLIVFAFVFMFFILSLLNIGKISCQSNSYQNLISILAGMGAIIFALVIFVVESSRDSETTDKIRVLLKQSYLFPLIAALILTFILLLIRQANLFTAILIALIGLLTIFSIMGVISVFLKKTLFLDKRLEVLKEILKPLINKEIDKRLGNNILLSKIEKDIKLVYNPLAKKDSSKYYAFTSEKKGIITNINLDELRAFGELLEEEANRNEYAFSKKTLEKTGNENEKANTLNPPKTKELKQNKERYLLRIFGEEVEKDDILIMVDKNILKDQQIINKLKDKLKRSFIIKKGSDSSRDIGKEIEGLGEQYVKEIRNRNLLSLRDLNKIYTGLIETFLDCISEYGTYSLEEAIKERGSFLGGWQEIKWITNDYRRFLEEAVRTKDMETIDEVFYLSITVARRAIDYRDQFVFQEFIQFNEYLYHYALQTQDKGVRDFVVDRAWRYLRELGNFHIVPKLENGEITIEDLNIFKDFAIYLLFPFQKILKSSFEEGDTESFKKFHEGIISMFGYYLRKSGASDIQRRLDNPNFTDNEKKELDRGKIVATIKDEIDLKRQQVFLGLASWIFYKLSMNKENAKLREFFDIISGSITDEISEFTRTYINASISFWGWDVWEMEGTKEGEAHFTNFSKKLNDFFIVKALSILSSKSDEEIQRIELPYDRNFANLIDDKNSGINKILDDIISNPENWKFVLSDDAIRKVKPLRNLFGKVSEVQKIKDSELKRKTKISIKKVEEFKNEIVEGFYETVTLREIFKHYGLYQDRTGKISKDKKNKFGLFNILDDKAAFFDEWYVHYLNWGEGYGHSLALNEDFFLFEKIIRSCTEIKESEFEDKIKDLLIDNLIIFASISSASISSFSSKFFLGSGKFVPKYSTNSKEYKDLKTSKPKNWEGWYKYKDKQIAVFGFYQQDRPESLVIILDKTKLGHLIQYSPLCETDSPGFRKDIFFMDVQSLSERSEALRRIIDEKPEWLIKKYSEEDKQISYLQEFVIINIYESFEFCKADDFIGYIFKPF